MTFGSFIKLLNSTKIFKCNRTEIAVNLLRAAGINIKEGQDINSTVTSWIDRKVPNNITVYFLNGNVNESGILEYFRRWVGDASKMVIVQAKFSKRKNMENCLVDCITQQPERFCQSLLEQFVDTLGIPLLPKMDNEMVYSCPYCKGLKGHSCPYCNGTGMIYEPLCVKGKTI